jgi:hypothetical protein
MGELYTDDEIKLIISIIDSDSLDIIEYPEFVQWWCTESPPTVADI